jgi:hypothetical protein
MSELLFEYRGKDLVKPLSDLLRLHGEDLARIDLEIAQHAAADIEAAKAMPNLASRKPASSGELAVRRLLGQRTELLVKRRECELWLAEAKRTPRYRWNLTMRDLAALYPLREA